MGKVRQARVGGIANAQKPRTIPSAQPVDRNREKLDRIPVAEFFDAGEQVHYTVTVKNNGPDAATGVTATDPLPGNTGNGTASTTQGTCSISKATVTCDLGTIANGGTVTITINVKPTKKGQITNTVSISSASPPDPNPGNNTASATTTVQP